MMTGDYSVPILAGEGDTDYARYMRTDMLLSLQREPAEMAHPDELLFQILHQSTELWLKLACFDARQAAELIGADRLDAAARLLARGSLAVSLVTEQLEILKHLGPWTFQTIRTVLGHGSGFESPGWVNARQTGQLLEQAFADLLARWNASLTAVYQGDPDTPLYRLAEALVEWDERIALWRARHYKAATRVIGHDVIGTKGTQVDTLARLIQHKFFPELWQVRTTLSKIGPMACNEEGGDDE